MINYILLASVIVLCRWPDQYYFFFLLCNYPSLNRLHLTRNPIRIPWPSGWLYAFYPNTVLSAVLINQRMALTNKFSQFAQGVIFSICAEKILFNL